MANHRLEETKKALIHTQDQAKVIVFYIYLCVCVCVLSFMSQQQVHNKEVFVAINDSDVTVAFAVKRIINYLRLLCFWTD